MSKGLRCIGLTAVFVFIAFSQLLADISLENLQSKQKIHGFTVVNLYDNSTEKAMGARFISDKYGFIIDMMQVESVPQAFYWIKTPPTSSMGEPHACEHLLLGKGNRGRYVATLEDMALGNSSAYTAQTRTCYHFNTPAGEETFYEIFEAKLQAFLHPDFTDEEIRREVCHIGVVVDPQDGKLSIDEKGTVYTEMVSSFEKHWYHFYNPMNKMVYGDNHPLSYASGGDPKAMRSMVPDDMWRFHKETHRLANMGVIVSIPDNISIDSFVERMSGILNRYQKNADSSSLVGIGAINYPPLDMAPIGTKKLVTYPSDRPEYPGYVLFNWPANLEIDYLEEFILQLFLETFASGETSNLYDLFINSSTRKIDLGGNYVFGGLDSDYGDAIYFGLSGIDNKHISETMLDSINALIVGEIERVSNFDDGSDQLTEFNNRFKSRLAQNKKHIDNYLNSPPMFGFRSGAGGGWLMLLESLEDEEGFRKSLVLKNRFAYAENLLASDNNIWKEYIDRWRLLTVKPYAVGASPSYEMITVEAEAKNARIAGYIEDFKKKYGVSDEQEAIKEYKKEFDAMTAELEALAVKDELPGFIDNPPMTLDDQLKYEIINLPNNIPLVASTFENMTASKIGIALNLNVIPESLLVYVPYIRSVMTDIGVIEDGKVIEYDEMVERLRNEVLSLNAYFSHGYTTGRVELVLAGRGNNLEELKNALTWMDAALYSPYLNTDNIPRMIDLIDQSLISFRNTMKRSEEAWVNYPSFAYRFQKNPLFMSTDCFLTQTHHYQRLKWLLTDPGNKNDRKTLSSFIDELRKNGEGISRDELIKLLTTVENFDESNDKEMPGGLKKKIKKLSNESKEIAIEIIGALKTTLADIPDANLADDWVYLCNETKFDIMVDPEKAIAGFNMVLDLIRKTDNARMFMISNSNDRKATLETIKNLVNKLDYETPSEIQQYAGTDRIVEKLKSRKPGIEKPVYVGLVNEGTRNGVLIFTAQKAGVYDTSETAVINCLSGKLFSGYGPHGLFMKTWGAGLAYSNGYRINPASGMIRYYAERCPDIAETMRFVVNQLKNAEDDPNLTDYAVAQVFGYTRAPSRYEQRGEAMASDLVDGFGPDRVKAFRQKTLDIKNRENLYSELKSRMESTYGPVLIGYGPPLSESVEGNFFIIGPEPQFESLENYIETAEGKQTVYRLYPRDFWLTM